jgi:hypothetical protein
MQSLESCKSEKKRRPSEVFEEDRDMEETERELLREVFEGMGAGTARMVIDREAGDKLSKDYELKGLENKGRYYVAKVFYKDGRPMADLLVDKQNGHIRILKP